MNGPELFRNVMRVFGVETTQSQVYYWVQESVRRLYYLDMDKAYPSTTPPTPTPLQSFKAAENIYAKVTNNVSTRFLESKETISISKGKKLFTFSPQMKPSTSINKCTISTTDSLILTPLYYIKIKTIKPASTRSKNDPSLSLGFLKAALSQELNDLPRWLWTTPDADKASKDEKMVMELMRLVLTNFYSNCRKPVYPTKTNERTPYAEFVIPIFKYFSSTTNLTSYAWCEKGLSICVPNATKLMDGIGVSTFDNLERTLIEASG